MRMNYDFGKWLTSQVGCKAQKISVNAGFTCPNRDGSIGTGGCTYCNNQTFNPEYCATGKTIRQQLEEGKAFFGRKYPDMKYLAYFQAYTNTYADLATLRERYEEAMGVDDVVGMVIGTRPDCMPTALLDYLEELSHRTFVLVEYGIVVTISTAPAGLSSPLPSAASVSGGMLSWDCRVKPSTTCWARLKSSVPYPSRPSSSISCSSSRARAWPTNTVSILKISSDSPPTSMPSLSSDS